MSLLEDAIIKAGSATALANALNVHRNTISNWRGELPLVARLALIHYMDSTEGWVLDLDDDFAVSPRGNTVSILIDPERRSIDDYHVSIGGNSWPMSVHNGTKRMVQVPRNAVGSDLLDALAANVELLNKIADQYEGTWWSNSHSEERGKWGEDTSGLLAALGELLEGVRRYWDSEEWIDWECSQGREEAALTMARTVIEAGTWTAGLDAHLEEFRRDGDIETDEAEREARALLERVSDELEDELDSAREDAEPDEETGERDEDAVEDVEVLLSKVSTLRKALEI